MNVHCDNIVSVFNTLRRSCAVALILLVPHLAPAQTTQAPGTLCRLPLIQTTAQPSNTIKQHCATVRSIGVKNTADVSTPLVSPVQINSQRGYFGITVSASSLENGAVRILSVPPQSTTHKAGIPVGSLIRAVDGVTFSDIASFFTFMNTTSPGQIVQCTYLDAKSNQEQTVPVTLEGAVESKPDIKIHTIRKNLPNTAIMSPQVLNAWDEVWENTDTDEENLSGINQLNRPSLQLQNQQFDALTSVSACESLRRLESTPLLGIWASEEGPQQQTVPRTMNRRNINNLSNHAKASQSNGFRLSSVINATGAHEIGLQHGDVITSVDNKPTPTFDACRRIVLSHKPGDVVVVTYRRNGKDVTAATRLVSYATIQQHEAAQLSELCQKTSNKITNAPPETTTITLDTLAIGIQAQSNVQTSESIDNILRPSAENILTPAEKKSESISTLAFADAQTSTLTIAPNPASQNIIINTLLPIATEPVRIAINTLAGVTQFSTTITPTEKEFSYPLNIGSLSQGVYIVTLRQGAMLITTKFIKGE